MTDYQIRRRKISDYIPDDHNANVGSERGLDMLETSLQTVGVGRSIVADAQGRVSAGNKTLEAAVNAGIEDVIEIETDGHVLIVHKRKDWDLTDPRGGARQYAYFDNRVSDVSLTWDTAVILDDLQAGVDLSAMFTGGEIAALTEQIAADALDEIPLSRGDVPDALWASDNEWDIPTLDLTLQADAVDLPVEVYGYVSRKSRMKGTWLFYTEDYRYEALWDDPTSILNSGCVSAAEPNFSCYAQMPLAVGLWAIYRKRWLARYWQSKGIRIFVDMNVNEKFYDLNLLGVPHGWKAYSTRGYSDRIESTEREYALACERAGTSSILFVVYGGGKTVKAHAGKRDWIWIPEIMDVKRKREQRYGEG